MNERPNIVKRICEGQGLKQTELAVMMGMSPVTISIWNVGIRPIPTKHLEKLHQIADAAQCISSIEDDMTPAKYKTKLTNLSPTAAKVLSCVPKQDSWLKDAVFGELRRRGVTITKKLFTGCLYSLKDDGLVMSSSSGWSQVLPAGPEKVSVRDTPPADKLETVKKEAPTLSPLEILAALAERSKQLTQDIESAALEVSEYIEAAEAKGEKLTQLQRLLKSIGE